MTLPKSVLLCLTMLLATAQYVWADTCDPAQVEVSTTPVIQQSPKRLVEARFQVRAPTEDADVLVFGDSIAARWGTAISRQFPGRVMRNLGLGGERTQELLWRLDQLYPASFRPRDVVLIIGTNNLTDISAMPCGIAEGIERVVDRMTAIWPGATLYVFGILPRGRNLAFRREARMAVNDTLKRRFSAMPTVRFIEVGEDQFSCQGGRCAELRPDMLHWTGRGYELLARALENAGLDR